MSKNIIPDMAFFGKSSLTYILIAVSIALVGVAAFGLGRLSALKEEQTGLVIHPAGEQSPAQDHGSSNETN